MPVKKEGDDWVPIMDDWAKSHGINEWALAKHIQLYGTKAHPFIRPVLNTQLKSIIRHALQKVFG